MAEQASVTSPSDPNSEAARRLYVGNIPRSLTNDELAKIVQEHGAVEKAEVLPPLPSAYPNFLFELLFLNYYHY